MSHSDVNNTNNNLEKRVPTKKHSEEVLISLSHKSFTEPHSLDNNNNGNNNKKFWQLLFSKRREKKFYVPLVFLSNLQAIVKLVNTDQ